MKKLLVLTIFALTIGWAATRQQAAVQPNPATAKQQKTVSEMTVNQYFLQIPDQYINADTRQRAMWIDTDDNANGHLEFTLPFNQLPEEAGLDDSAFGSMQVFKKKSGGVIIGLAVNICIENDCEGQLLFLDYNRGKWDDVTEKMAVSADNEEIVEILNNAPAYEKTIEEGAEVKLAIEFSGPEKLVSFIADCKKTCDGGVIAKMFKWNGEGFVEFEYVEGL